MNTVHQPPELEQGAWDSHTPHPIKSPAACSEAATKQQPNCSQPATKQQRTRNDTAAKLRAGIVADQRFYSESGRIGPFAGQRARLTGTTPPALPCGRTPADALSPCGLSPGSPTTSDRWPTMF